jgi:hypothetical protein|eukprot:Stramenopile-MAST_4_protein_3013
MNDNDAPPPKYVLSDDLGDELRAVLLAKISSAHGKIGLISKLGGACLSQPDEKTVRLRNFARDFGGLKYFLQKNCDIFQLYKYCPSNPSDFTKISSLDTFVLIKGSKPAGVIPGWPTGYRKVGNVAPSTYAKDTAGNGYKILSSANLKPPLLPKTSIQDDEDQAMPRVDHRVSASSRDAQILARPCTAWSTEHRSTSHFSSFKSLPPPPGFQKEAMQISVEKNCDFPSLPSKTSSTVTLNHLEKQDRYDKNYLMSLNSRLIADLGMAGLSEVVMRLVLKYKGDAIKVVADVRRAALTDATTRATENHTSKEQAKLFERLGGRETVIASLA